MSNNGSDLSRDLNNDNYNNYDNNDNDCNITETNMMVHLLANDDKLIPTDERWEWNKDDDNNHNKQLNNNYNNDELDDNIGNYINNNNNVFDKNTIEQHENIYENINNNNVFQKKEPIDSKIKDNLSFSEQPEKNKITNNEFCDKSVSNEDIMLEKLNMLRKLAELKTAGVTLSQVYNMNSDLNMMRYEYELHKNIRAKQNGINWMSSMSLNMIYGLEMMNDTYNPFDLKLTGWSAQMNADINNYYDVFGELYEKYNQAYSLHMDCSLVPQ